MKHVSGKQFAKLVERRGWLLLRIQGSHYIYGKPGVEVRLSIPIHKNENLKVGLQKHLMKMAGIEESDI
jgi:predicted RNA binding protein YcfA (HicA-like mRNA interferase family)